MHEHVESSQIITAEEILTSLVNPALRDDPITQAAVTSTVQELAMHPDLSMLYRETLIEGNQNLLKQKTKKQIEVLHRLLLSEQQPTGLLNGIRKRIEQAKKLKVFQTRISQLTPIRQDKNPELNEFICPRETAHTAKGWTQMGGWDGVVQANRYVFGSFDALPHFLAYPRWTPAAKDTGYQHGAGHDFRAINPAQAKSVCLRKLDETDLESHAEIGMVDITPLAFSTTEHSGRGILKTYLDNIFDYRQGKKILAYYLACVFETPEAGLAFFQK